MIDWERFAARVTVGTMVRGCDSNGEETWRAILLENYPYWDDEMLAHAPTELDRHRVFRDSQEYPSLRVQDFTVIADEIIKANSRAIQYLIDGQWLSFDELMALP